MFVVYSPGRQDAGRRWQRPGVAALGMPRTASRGPPRELPTDRLNCGAFAPDGRTLVTGGRQGQLTVWDPATGKPRVTPTGATGLIRTVAFAPDGKTLVSASLMGQAFVVWDTATWEVVRTVGVPERAVIAAAFSPDGKTLAVGTNVAGTGANGLRLFDVPTFQPREGVAAVDRPVGSVAFAPDGKVLAAACTGLALKQA